MLRPGILRCLRRVAALAFVLPVLAHAGEPVVLHAADGVSVYGTLSRCDEPGKAILLLFHQAGANRHEYDPLIPALNALGFDTLAIDQRAGGALFGGTNRTVTAFGHHAGYLDALPDMEAALAWARSHQYRRIIGVGSSYSASLVILLAARHPGELTAIASFSPGEYFADKNLVKNAAAKVEIPFYITTDPREAARVDEVLEKAHGDNIVHYRPHAGVHGASTLVKARDPNGYAANLHDFSTFLERFAH